MAHPQFDYSHLSPEERLQLVEDLWDSLALDAPESVPIPASHAQELDRRLEAYRRGETATRPWHEALDRIDERLTGRGG
ncbi:MAG: addiction module protein [Gemmatimonas sp.]|jgi:putative addiction module component (TIGR02574 family)|uniref:addiction module protein n=1 Tax=Gemmatimonas sp. TaxID=1962908 RepID=UPI00391F80B2|nr:addiction module protein [Gemmatimonadota bacterium]